MMLMLSTHRFTFSPQHARVIGLGIYRMKFYKPEQENE